jgi:hypothetical protein
MRYFYDTEFIEDGHTIDLISIGIVAEDGREYYAINRHARWPLLVQSAWHVENVLPHLPLSAPLDQWRRGPLVDPKHPDVKGPATIADEVLAFLTADNDGTEHRELWAYYAATDHVALYQLWGRMIDLPVGVPWWTHELMQEWERAGRPPKPPQSTAHNALADARWSRDLFNLVTDSNR